MSLTKIRTVTPARALALAAAFTLAGCGGGGEVSPGADGASDTSEYVAERTTTDGVETVRTVSGSRWGGDPRLVEQLSIGDEMGDEAYLFGSIAAAWATADRIYLVDVQVPAVRAFDRQGSFISQIGSVGQGPGEYSRPLGLAVADDGRVFVTDVQGARLNVFGPDGEHLDDWSLGSPQSALGLQLTLDGEVYSRMIELPNEITTGNLGTLREGMRLVGPDGMTGDPVFPPEIDYDPPTVSIDMGGNSMQMAILPFTPSYQWAFAPGGEMIAGVGNEYRFEIHAPGGKTTVVEKAWQPTPVDPGERSFRADVAARQFRRMSPEFSIPESDVPAHKPAFIRLRPDRSGRVWLTRQGPSRPDPDCNEVDGGGGGGMTLMLGARGDTSVSMGGPNGADADDYGGDCWANTYVFDVFELATGDFLGAVPAPEPGFTPLFIDGDTVLASVTDAAGTVRLKEYRLAIESRP